MVVASWLGELTGPALSLPPPRAPGWGMALEVTGAAGWDGTTAGLGSLTARLLVRPSPNGSAKTGPHLGLGNTLSRSLTHGLFLAVLLLAACATPAQMTTGPSVLGAEGQVNVADGATVYVAWIHSTEGTSLRVPQPGMTGWGSAEVS